MRRIIVAFALGGLLVLAVVPATASGSRGSPQSFPSGAVMFFDLDQCPKGWMEYVEVNGRAVVGGPAGVTVGNEPLASGENRRHNHVWSSYTWEGFPNGGDWSSFDNQGREVAVVDWSDGIGNDGAGFYPFGVFSPIPNGRSTQFYTSKAKTSDVMPYIQLLPCVKD